MYIYIYVYMSICIYVCMYVCMYVYIYAYIYIYVYMYICVYVYMYICIKSSTVALIRVRLFSRCWNNFCHISSTFFDIFSTLFDMKNRPKIDPKWYPGDARGTLGASQGPPRGPSGPVFRRNWKLMKKQTILGGSRDIPGGTRGPREIQKIDQKSFFC